VKSPTPIRAVLFDLDGTLLDSNMQTFLPSYFKALSACVAHLVAGERFVECLLQATQAMMDNDGRETNAEVFARAFYPKIGHPKESLEPVFERFYDQEYPKLGHLTRRIPGARRVVSSAFELGHKVVIATNPLFPAKAIDTRMQWAGIEGLPYNLVTSYENSRACKPNLRYFTDILAYLGLAAESCLVVGNEDLDMVAARLGCPTFLVTDHAAALGPEIPQPTYRGTLLDLEKLLER
jgi:FMN phosphatase YigB (HAD superfamily)